MTYIAWLHVKGGHPLTDPAVAARALEWRDALIGDMRDHDVLDRDMFAAAAARLRPTIDETARGLAAFAHLDQGWDGTGVRPSSLAALTASIGRDQG